MEEITVAVMLMARIQPADGNTETVPSYDAKAVSEVNASSKVHEQVSHVKRKTIIQTSDDDQIDSNIIFDDPYVENNGGTSDHDSNAHDEYHEIQMLAYNVKKEAENKKRLNNELKNQKMLLQKELETSKKAFKERENRYLEDIVDLKEKLSSHDRIVYKMGQSIQTIHILGKKPNKLYDHFLKVGLGYKNPERLKKAIAAQPKMYDGEMLHSAKYKIDSLYLEETLEDAKESRLKMRNKMVQLNYGKLNALYETFVPQQEFSVEQTYFSVPSTSNNGSESKEVTLNLPIPKCQKRRENIKLEYQKLFNLIKATRTQHKKELDELIEHVNQKTYAYADVLAQNQDLFITISELKNKLQTVDKGNNVNTKFDKSETLGTLLCVTPLPKNIAVKAKKVSTTKVNTDRSKLVTSHLTPKNEQSRKHNENVLARGMYIIIKTETQTPDSKNNINVCNSTGVESSNSVRRQKSKATKSKDRVLKNKTDKRPVAHVRKMSSSVSIDSNKRETMHSNVCQSNACVLSTKTVNVVNDGSNIVCVSCGKDVFLLSHEKCVARYALSRNSSVKRALFTTPIAAKSKNLGATFVVAKSKLSVAKTSTATNKVIQLILWIVDSGCSKHMTGNLQLLRNFIEKFTGSVLFSNDHFAAITGYGDYVQGNLTICHVYYVEGLGHNLFLVGQFCDGDLEVAFRSNTCYVQNLEGDDLLTGSRDSNLYTISIFEMAASSPVCLMSRATSTKSWLWHRRLSHLNFGPLTKSQYYATSSPEVSDNSAANTLDNENISSSSLIVVEEDEAPQIVSSSAEQVATEPNSPLLNENADESVQEDVADFNGNVFYNAPPTPVFEGAESSLTYQDPSNMYEFHQKHRLMSRIEPKNIKKAMLDASWIESMQDELNQFKRLDVWELFERPIGRNIIAVKGFGKTRLMLKTQLFGTSIVDPTLFTRRHEDDILLVQIYVDDINFGSTKPAFSTRFAKLMKDNFEMSMIGEMKFFLGLQKDYGFELIAYSDADLTGCNDDCKSTSGGIQFLGDKLVSWLSKKQDCTTMSTVEAEYVSLSACCAQVIWMRTQLLDYGFRYTKIPIYCDSQSAIAISCNPVQHSRTKHINIRYHFIKEHVEKGTIELYFVGTKYQLADLFTKAFPKEEFEYLVHRIGMRCMTPTELECLAKLSP
ncbi:integrase, catalytic region, zinc finger, CCHC-type containing protein [Tanacetum coccineum]